MLRLNMMVRIMTEGLYLQAETAVCLVYIKHLEDLGSKDY